MMRAFLSSKSLYLVSGIVCFSCVLFLLPATAADDTTLSTSGITDPDLLQLQPGEQKYQVGVSYELPLSKALVINNDEAPTDVEIAQSNLTHQTLIVQKGDNLSSIFKRGGFSLGLSYKIDNLGGDAHKLRKMRPGDAIEFISEGEQLMFVRYPFSRTETLVVSRVEGQFETAIETMELETRVNFARADIVSNFWNAGINGGLDAGLIMDLANVFGWDVDFALDIRAGDSFAVLFEEQYANGEYIKTGNILAAEFINQGDVFQAVRSEDGNFYTPEGKAMRKAFLRAPVNFKYISSNFNPRRKHPVTGKVRAHRGIDYAARTGTPVVAAGDGKIIRSGYNQFNGNYVVIKHSEIYVTKYLHLNKRKVKKGQRVGQGDLIGTVGATGRVTGAHLHYEFLVSGFHKNPKTVKLPEAQSLEGQPKADFIAYSQPFMQSLNNQKRFSLAMAN
ncbi:peptidoglycan DD-metalloendopeptidase family protein [Motilimonas pumila]|nr:peptidoglycan DD-metalloendopeptidase family protein [Motilimonas pumila]